MALERSNLGSSAARIVTTWGLALVLGGTSAGCAKPKADTSAPRPIVAEREDDAPARTFSRQHLANRQRASLPRAHHSGPAELDHRHSCPLSVPGTSVRAERVDEGVEIVFTTYGDIAELRKRVRDLAYTHSHPVTDEDKGRCGCPLVGRDGVPFMSEASTSAVPVARGAKLVLTPNERNKAGPLRTRVVERLEQLEAQLCPLRDELTDSDQTAHSGQ